MNLAVRPVKQALTVVPEGCCIMSERIGLAFNKNLQILAQLSPSQDSIIHVFA
jgi:hypothetical protein